MKQTYLLAGLLGLCAAGVGAIELNTDAMKKMQEEGHKIVEEQQGARMLKLPNGRCLQAAGGNLVSAKCNDKASNQKWYFDDKGRLANQEGGCVSAEGGGKNAGANAIVQQCSGAGAQKWKLDGAKRLVNEHGMCLQANGDNVVTAQCSKNANQKWG
jgi:hypothetical protein